MPELPEVETIRRGLNKFILKSKLQKVEVLCPKSFIGTPTTGKIIGIRRFGKALVLDMNNSYSMLVHLRMTGQLIYDPNDGPGLNPSHHPKDGPELNPPHHTRYAAGHPSDNFTASLPNKQTRVILEFDTGTLYFNDQRKFGFIKVIATKDVEQDSFISKLAKEPWDMDASEFYEKLQRHKNSIIKAVILDQTVICGLGNIYADEALFASKIHPARRVGSVTSEETELLLRSARQVMERSIESGGSTMATYVKADGTKGDYLEQFAQVFRREGKPCPACGQTIIKTKIAGRGTHLCPNCQRMSDD